MKQSAALVLLVVLSGMILTACETIPTTETTRVACESFEPISYSAKHDTAETAKQVRAHNAAWAELCGNQDLPDGEG